MTTELSPRPWRVDGKLIYTADGDFIGEMEHSDDSRFVVEVVEAYEEYKRMSLEIYDSFARSTRERDKLRDIVRRLCDLFTPGTIHPDGTMERLLREARAAIGEDAK